MKAGALVLGLLAAVPASGGSTSRPGPAVPDPGAQWDLRWMAGPPSAVTAGRPPHPTARLRALGEALYHQRCASCHGEAGDGKGPLAARLRVPPTSFVAGVYKLRSTPTGSIPTNEDLFATLTRGVHGTPMMPWKELREEERWALVFRIEAFSVRFREERPARPVRVPAPPSEEDSLRQTGKRLYASLQCAACHGERGAADGPGAEIYRRADPAHDVRIRDFTRGRFIRGTEMADIFLTLRVGLEGTPMAAYDVLTDGDVWALAAYVRSLIRERPIYDFPPAGREIH
jgi:cytochrome c oxidase cbb3-type subunit 2